jgi:serine/threonine protein kinase
MDWTVPVGGLDPTTGYKKMHGPQPMDTVNPSPQQIEKANRELKEENEKFELLKKPFQEKIDAFLKIMCEQKTDGIEHYLCEFDKTHNKNGEAYILNSTFFKDKKILGEGAYGKVYDAGLWTIDSDDSHDSHDSKTYNIVIKTIKLGSNYRIEPLIESYINLVLINGVIIKNPTIGLVTTFGIFYCGKKGEEKFCMDDDKTEITKNKDIFIVQEKINGTTLRNKKVDFVFTKDMLIELFEILIKLEENGIYHSDLNTTNIIMSDTGKIYLIDFGLASFMFNDKRLFQRERTYFSKSKDDNMCTAFNDFFAVCKLLSEYNRELFSKIYKILETIFNEFDPKPLVDMGKISYPFSYYLQNAENTKGVSSDKNFEIYNKYTMRVIYDMCLGVI